MNHPSKKSKPERDLETALGGRRVPAPRNDGRTDTVFIRQLPLRFGETYVELMLAGDEQGRIELCLGKTAHWDIKYKNRHEADIYTVDAQARLLAAADELNFPTALQQIERRKNAIGGLEGMLKRLYAFQASMMQDAMSQMVKHAVDSAFSSPPASPPSGAPMPKSGTTGASTSSPSPSSNTPAPMTLPPSVNSTPHSSPLPPPGVFVAPPPK